MANHDPDILFTQTISSDSKLLGQTNMQQPSINHHWNRDQTFTPAANEHEWYHYDEPSIIDVTSYDDVTRAIEDGRLDKITDEHTRYMRRTDREISEKALVQERRLRETPISRLRAYLAGSQP